MKKIITHGGSAHLDDPAVAFAHPGGFIAKTKSKDVDDALRLVRLAVKETS